MNLKPRKRAPALIALGVILLVSGVAALRLDYFERLEAITYDARARLALRYSAPVATNLGFVFIDEATIDFVRTNRSLGYRFGLYWPRQVYARLVAELADQHARAAAFDVIFGELRPDHEPVRMADDRLVESDEFFAQQLRRAGNVLLAVTPDSSPPALFLTNALAVGDISTDKDADGILRRARAFRMYRKWHPAFEQLAANPEYGVDLRRARVEPGRVVLPRQDGEQIVLPLDAEGRFDVADFWGEKLPAGMERRARPFEETRRWHMGVVLGALEIGADLGRAEVDLAGGRIVLRGKAGLKRVIPVDSQGRFYIDWRLPPNHPQLAQQAVKDLLVQNRLRLAGQTNGLVERWTGKLAVIGSAATGNDLTDRGATPLRADTLLASKHWNVANSIITGRFVRRAPLAVELGMIALLGVVAAALTWEMRVLAASGLTLLLIGGYLAAAAAVYVSSRYWLPVVLPAAGAVLMTHVSLVTWRVLFEQADKRRVKSVFSTMVSPKIVQEVLKAEKLSLGGARREVTVLFSDVRGFTGLTDASQERAAEQVRQQELKGAAAEACFDEQARETLGTINQYLGVVANTVVQHDGTLDKFIGDCVMAFWGAPTPNPRHAVAGVRAALEAQRAIYELNRQRAAENRRRAAENQTRAAAGLAPHPLLPILLVGTGINTGMAVVGMMGSEIQHVVRQGNYTVFGREVNLASRLEGLSGRGRVFISQSTYEQLRAGDPALAESCIPLPPQTVKGIRGLVPVYEVPWRPAGAPSLEEEFGLAEEKATLIPGGGVGNVRHAHGHIPWQF